MKGNAEAHDRADYHTWRDILGGICSKYGGETAPGNP